MTRALLLASLLMLLAAAPAAAQTAVAGSAVEDAAAALRTDPVFVHPDADPTLEDPERIRALMQDASIGPAYLAVLPEEAESEAGGSAEGLIYALREQLRRPGTYVVFSGTEFHARSTLFNPAPDVEEALQQGGGSVDGIAAAFFESVRESRAGGGGASDGSGGGDGNWLLLGIVALGGGAFVISRRRRRRAQQAELADVKREIRDDLVVLGEELRALDLDVQMPNTSAEVRADYETAVNAYTRAEEAWELARRPEDLQDVGAGLEEGRWALASVRARLENRPLPERRPPCFFDPRHGPSTRDVVWAPYGGQPRGVPACEADALRVEAGEEPMSREVTVGGVATPYYAAGPMYAPFMGGMFGLGTGLFGGMILADLMTPDIGWGGGFGDAGGGGGFGGGGGDWGGGGDFGGGGGDFGGGGGDF